MRSWPLQLHRSTSLRTSRQPKTAHPIRALAFVRLRRVLRHVPPCLPAAPMVDGEARRSAQLSAGQPIPKPERKRNVAHGEAHQRSFRWISRAPLRALPGTRGTPRHAARCSGRTRASQPIIGLGTRGTPGTPHFERIAGAWAYAARFARWLARSTTPSPAAVGARYAAHAFMRSRRLSSRSPR